MNKLKISQVQFQASHIPALNAEILEKSFNRTLKFKPHLICTPECSNMITNDKNYLITNAPYQNTCPVLKMAKDFAKKNKITINLGSLLLKIKNQRKLVNRSYFINNNGVVEKTYDKIHMFDVTLKNGESYKESDFYSSGKELKMTNVLGHSIGHTICYDLRYPKMFRALAKKGSQIIVVPSAFTRTTGKAHWHSLIKARAIENGVFILAPNQWGVNNEKRVTYGHTLIVDPWGETLAEAEDGEMIIAAELDLNRVRECQNAIPVLDNDRNFD